MIRIMMQHTVMMLKKCVITNTTNKLIVYATIYLVVIALEQCAMVKQLTFSCEHLK